MTLHSPSNSLTQVGQDLEETDTIVLWVCPSTMRSRVGNRAVTPLWTFALWSYFCNEATWSNYGDLARWLFRMNENINTFFNFKNE